MNWLLDSMMRMMGGGFRDTTKTAVPAPMDPRKKKLKKMNLGTPMMGKTSRPSLLGGLW